MKRNYLFLVLTSLTLLFGCNGDSTNITIPGVKGPYLTLERDFARVDASFDNITIDNDLLMPLPDFEESYLSIKSNGNGGIDFRVGLNWQEILGDDVEVRDPQTLPGGRALPGVPTGALPGVSFTLTNFHNVTIYAGKNFFGIFYPLNLEIDGSIISSRYYLGKKAVGTLSLVGRDSSGENSGFLLLLAIDDTTKKYLKRKYLR
ncbi:MAG: hypothetical protein EP326_11760 [Deltaproteobacteria bacterium]|jgi:hypothetical protein|nr:MAG: hypothetical protein EP326_11760 [Deltaproteobacteria bacterium]TNF28677.1 MAG: hypothetical protein EP319_08555 [Deltaproteobacteria bacterium]